MVVVECGTLFQPQVVAIPVVAIVIEDNHVFGPEALDNAADDSRLAGSGTSRYANDDFGFNHTGHPSSRLLVNRKAPALHRHASSAQGVEQQQPRRETGHRHPSL
jgi:hypothetical protein